MKNARPRTDAYQVLMIPVKVPAPPPPSVCHIFHSNDLLGPGFTPEIHDSVGGQYTAARQGNISNYVWGSLEKITQLSSFYVCVYVNTDCQCPSLLPLPTVSQHNNKVTQLRLAPIIIYTNIYILRT